MSNIEAFAWFRREPNHEQLRICDGSAPTSRGRGYPHPFRGSGAKRYRSGSSRNCYSLIVIPLDDSKLGGRTNSAMLEKFKQATVAFVDSADRVTGVDFRIGEQDQPAATPAGGTLHLAQVPVWTGACRSQFRQQLRFEIRRYCVFQSFRLIMHFPPFHAEHL